MNQDQFFFQSEGDHWFQRNKVVLELSDKFDWPSYLINLLSEKAKIKNILELGCSNGYRLNLLRKTFKPSYVVGVDASIKAIQDGKARYPELSLHQGLLSQVPLQEDFDLVIVNFVLHWVDRKTLVKSVAEIDRLTRDGGILVIGDFLPDFQQRRCYHHCAEETIYTYKQDYAKIFEAFGTYRELRRVTFDHEKQELAIKCCDSFSRCVCVVLQKSLYSFYPKF